MVGMTTEDIAFLASLALPKTRGGNRHSSSSSTSSTASNNGEVSDSSSVSSSLSKTTDAKMAWATDGVHCEEYIDGYDHFAEEKETMKAISVCLAQRTKRLEMFEHTGAGSSRPGIFGV